MLAPTAAAGAAAAAGCSDSTQAAGRNRPRRLDYFQDPAMTSEINTLITFLTEKLLYYIFTTTIGYQRKLVHIKFKRRLLIFELGVNRIFYETLCVVAEVPYLHRVQMGCHRKCVIENGDCFY